MCHSRVNYSWMCSIVFVFLGAHCLEIIWHVLMQIIFSNKLAYFHGFMLKQSHDTHFFYIKFTALHCWKLHFKYGCCLIKMDMVQKEDAMSTCIILLKLTKSNQRSCEKYVLIMLSFWTARTRLHVIIYTKTRSTIPVLVIPVILRGLQVQERMNVWSKEWLGEIKFYFINCVEINF